MVCIACTAGRNVPVAHEYSFSGRVLHAANEVIEVIDGDRVMMFTGVPQHPFKVKRGDHVRIRYILDVKELVILDQGARNEDPEPGSSPGEPSGRPVIDDRAFYEARNGMRETGDPDDEAPNSRWYLSCEEELSNRLLSYRCRRAQKGAQKTAQKT
jgi:hypothetical protein